MTEPKMPKVGQITTVYGKRCRIVAVLPAGTIDVEEINGDHAWRVTGLCVTKQLLSQENPQDRICPDCGAAKLPDLRACFDCIQSSVRATLDELSEKMATKQQEVKTP